MKLKFTEIAVFGMLGALIYASKVLMEALPNVHLIGAFIVAMTVVFRAKALYPLYVFVFLVGLFNGFATWWIPYLYIWTVLWGAAMLLPKNAHPLVYMLCSGLHGLLFGTLYAPAQALLFGLSFKGMLSWIVAGLVFDCVHGVSNFLCGLLIVPMIKILRAGKKKLGI